METLGIYVHIPFCRTKCNYCAFHSLAGAEELYEPYISALCKEISGAGFRFQPFLIDTLYFGGGTPSILPSRLLAQLILAVKSAFKLTAAAEITIEANPGTVSSASLLKMRSLGFNRLSLGVQSFSPDVLSAMGRIHSAVDARNSVFEAKEAGFENISLDLMNGFPGQTADGVRRDLEQAVKLDVNHISSYSLKLEPSTPLEADVLLGTRAMPDDDEDEKMYDYASVVLGDHGFRRYEISNYARVGFESQHNMKYWRYCPYLGFGAAAHSFWGDRRWANTENVSEYIEQVNQGLSPVGFQEKLSLETRKAEFCFLALRIIDGLSANEYRRRFGSEFFVEHAAAIADITRNGWGEADGEAFRLTPTGMKFSNQAFEKFLPDKV